MRAPYYQDELVTLYHGDARELVRHLEVDARSVLITDPVWPNALPSLAGAEDPEGLFSSVLRPLVNKGLRRAIVILGVDSDPRFLAAVPDALEFVRVTWLRYACPSYKGPILVGAEPAYVFGSWGMAYKGQKVWPGEIVSTTSRSRDRWKTAHPCPRRIDHLEGLIRGYTRPEDIIIDLFAGSGTTVDAAARNRRRVIACELVEQYCEEIAEKAQEASAQGNLPMVAP